MIGFYDYTVILTYLSVISAGIGTYISLAGKGHPYIGVMLLMFCGLCDTFDGRVARSKKNRTKKEKDFGIQIDSLTDLVAFGVLPAAIGVSLYKNDVMHLEIEGCKSILAGVPMAIILIVSALFVLCALIRLAYFNITVEETQSDALGDEKYYFGMPVTSTALIFPTFLLFRYCLQCFNINISIIYFVLLILVGLLFICKFKLKKPNSKEIYLLVGLGALEFIAVLIIRIMIHNG